MCARLDGRPRPAGELSDAVDLLLLDLRNGLSPWIGADAYAALVRRSIQHVADAHPAAAELPWHDETPRSGDAVLRHGAGAVAGACVAVIRAIIDQLAAVIGPRMAIQLVERSLPQKPGVRAQPKGDDDA